MLTAQLINSLVKSGVAVGFLMADDSQGLRDNLTRRFSRDPETGEQAASPIGKQVPSDAEKAVWKNIVHYGFSRLSPEAKGAAMMVLLVFSDKTWRKLSKVLYVGSSLTHVERRSAEPGAMRRSIFILATMSRYIGISGSFGEFYYHPPGKLGSRMATSVSVRTQLMTAMSQAELMGSDAEDLAREMQRMRQQES